MAKAISRPARALGSTTRDTAPPRLPNSSNTFTGFSPGRCRGRAAGGDFVLHPSLLDSALQGAIALREGVFDGSAKPSLPFALESLRVYGPCTSAMLAWVRPAHDERATAAGLVKVDLDLCDRDGRVCVQMSGFSSRPLDSLAFFDEAHYQSIIAGVLSNRISADDAVELG